MRNPFKRFKAQKGPEPEKVVEPAVEESIEETENVIAEEPVVEEPKDSFIEWRRTQIRGGIERRERNDIFEAYSVFGTDESEKLICRYYHRYPEHEKDFDLSSTRVLTFDEFNRRLLSELDKGDMKLDDYLFCIEKAEELSDDTENSDEPAGADFTEDEIVTLHDFCEALDTLEEKTYINQNGVYSCEGKSVVGEEVLNIRFRKPIRHDPLDAEIAGVKKEAAEGYDIENLWIMGVYNRLYEHSSSCKVTRLTSEWSLEKESLYLIRMEGFKGIDGALLVAVGEADQFRRFGFYSLDFSKK